MISVAGIRGVVGTSLTPELALKFAAAFGTFVGGGPVALARDSRTANPPPVRRNCTRTNVNE
ncbi:MAG: hypothetical protein KJ620_00835 [Candidatus Edwardsbacteria bacterium]|nr:hypothetical protein [Candidatus Edwardsbacteria bacterium]MBU1576461.1 hypothetical protein [Candidatus Edwardsbacteria bacterium]MBU2464480.1 hypothetical protein [Candidatus Edwardsbacteria bacterium]MBU2594534.1 hypothetical protein [Candidatus Edwardsbacteria bacterium]